ncbi:MAG: alpha/beta hydrolase [Bacteroidetes bacterium]|nr:alpha/beta hydrolase [Bacteroidota bacterium]
MNKCCSIYLLTWALLALSSCKLPRTISRQNEISIWQKIQYKTDGEMLASDTAFLMVSNRHFFEQQTIFADEETDTAQRHLLYVSKVNDIWKVQKIQSLQEGISLFPHKNWVLYTEGMGKTFTGNIERAYLMTSTYNVNVILFDYASINSTLGIKKNFDYSLRNSNISSAQYARFLKEIESIHRSTALFQKQSISIFLHSMCNLMFRRMMLDQLFERNEEAPFIENIIFNAPCVNRKNHHRWISKITFAKNIYVNFNKADYKLNGAMLLSGNRKLGSKPKFPFSKNVYYMDFHAAVGKTHNYFLNIPSRSFVMSKPIQNYFFQILNGKKFSHTGFGKSPVVGFEMIP